MSAIEGFGTYGYGDLLSDRFDDLIEIMGLLTPHEKESGDSVVGWLTAEEVFRRIKEAVDV